MTQRSYIQDILDKRKAKLSDLRENDNDAYTQELLESLDRNLAKIGKTLESSTSKVALKPGRKSPEQLVQEKLLGIAKTTQVRQDLDRASNKVKVTADARAASDTSDHLSQLKTTLQIAGIRSQKQLDSIIVQLKKLNKKGGSGSEDKSLIETAWDKLTGGKDDEHRSRSRRGRNGRGSVRPPRPSVREGGSPRLRSPSRLSGTNLPEVRPSAGRSVFATARDKLGSVVSSGRERIGGAIDGAAGAARSVSPGLTSMAESIPLGKIGSGMALAEGVYNVGSELLSDRPTDEKVSNIASAGIEAGKGWAGAEAGAAAGATLGSIVGPVGTAVGGAAGGILGGIYGPEAIDAVVGSLKQSVADSGMGDTIGRAVAIPMSLISDDARSALVHDFKTKIIPALSQPFNSVESTLEGWGTDTDHLVNKMGDYTDALEAGGKTIFQAATSGSKDLIEGLLSAGKTLFGGAKDAVGKIAKGYNEGGISGAVGAADSAASGMRESATSAGQTVGSAGSKAASRVAEGVDSAGHDLKYASDKGSASALELAMGFSADKGFKGMSDSQSKAYAGNVMKTESGGKLGIENQYGFAGQYQFGADALADNGLINKDKLSVAKKLAGDQWYKGGKHKEFMADNSNWTNEGGRDAFLKDKKLQDNTFVKYTDKNIAAGYKSGALSESSTPEDIAGYAKAAHLKGSGGANKFFLEGKDSADANGMRVSTYAKGASDSMNMLSTKVDDEKSKGALGSEGKPVGSIVPTTGASVAVATGPAQAPPTTTAKLGLVSESGQEQSLAQMSAASTSKLPTAKATQSPVVTASRDQPSAELPVATAKATPLSMASAGLPPEVQNVNVTNPAPAQDQQSSGGRPAGNSQIASSSASIELGDIPVRIDDFGLVLINMGHG